MLHRLQKMIGWWNLIQDFQILCVINYNCLKYIINFHTPKFIKIYSFYKTPETKVPDESSIIEFLNNIDFGDVKKFVIASPSGFI